MMMFVLAFCFWEKIDKTTSWKEIFNLAHGFRDFSPGLVGSTAFRLVV
jgi:hypothetical protein